MTTKCIHLTCTLTSNKLYGLKLIDSSNKIYFPIFFIYLFDSCTYNISPDLRFDVYVIARVIVTRKSHRMVVYNSLKTSPDPSVMLF